jgi:Na+-translocating ferredoxin:NAD+ oxidoreductase RnfG subunit
MDRIIIFLIFCISSQTNATEIMGLKDFLKTELSRSAKMTKESFDLSKDQLKSLTDLAPDAQDLKFEFYYGKTAAGKLETACTVVPQKGKEGTLVIGVCFSGAGLVSDVRILSSQEERGRKVEEESFLKQFHGKKISQSFTVGKDVDAVSGATWSSKAVAEAVRKSSYAFQTFVIPTIGGK